MRYIDREDAGRRLAPEVVDALKEVAPGSAPSLVLGVPRGGVVVAFEVAKSLGAELGVALGRKLGAPHNPELAVGALGEYGPPVVDDELVMRLGVTEAHLRRAVEAESKELRRRAERYRAGRPAPAVEDRVVVVVDDGIATGATLRAVLAGLRSKNPRHLVCAVPVGAPSSVALVAREVDTMVCPSTPTWFRAVGEWYEVFGQTSDDEVISLLAAAASHDD